MFRGIFYKSYYEKMKIFIRTIFFIVFSVSTAYANWIATLEINSGKHSSQVRIGSEGLASSGYDEGLDIPLIEKGVISAYFSHPEWKVKKGGKGFSDFYQDLRSENNREIWELKVDTGLTGNHKIHWNLPQDMPKGLKLSLVDKGGKSLDMMENDSYVFIPLSSNIFTIEAAMESPPVLYPPYILEVLPRNKSLLIKWEPDEEAAGYKVHLAEEPTVYIRTVDIGNETKLKIVKLENGKTYYVALSAYNEEGVESGYSEEISAVPFNSVPTSPLTDWQYVEEGEDLIVKLSGARDADGEPVSYEVEVYSDRQMRQLSISKVSDEGEVNLGKLSRGTYYWRARATDATDYGSWSGTRIISVGIESEEAVESFKKAYGRKRL